MSAVEDNDDHDNDPRRPHSIDLTIELERQLDNESLPSTPSNAKRPQSLDPQILAHIITDLTSSLADMTRQRDELAQSLSQIRARENDLTDTLAHMTDKCSKLQEEVDTANHRAKEDENTISVLRTKVEESSFGRVTLQAGTHAPPVRKSKVQSTAFWVGCIQGWSPRNGGPPSSKRASFAPLTGSAVGRINAHRRISSVSDTGFSRLDGGSPHPSASPVNFTFPDYAAQTNMTHQLPPSRRTSGIFGRGSPPSSIIHSEESAEGEMLRKELDSMRSELDEAKIALSEANEAREASDLCVKALRTFIEENNVGATMSSAGGSTGGTPLSFASPSSQADARKSAQGAGAWGFKLWRTGAPATSSVPTTPATPAILPTMAPNPVSLPPPPQPLSRKLGDFFGTRSGSISSPPPSDCHVQNKRQCIMDCQTRHLPKSLSPSQPVLRAQLPRPSVLVKDTQGIWGQVQRGRRTNFPCRQERIEISRRFPYKWWILLPPFYVTYAVLMA
ncbi:hypothetical protein BU15DRAFT_58937 [Melanogaster broomeanus]|nr:hypothetical protein BU15DRAFT_58937 [Melanogaster broomeanus]